VGETLFRRESGAVASQFHDPPSIEPYSAEVVAAERAIVLGKKSGIDSIRIKAAELGLELSGDEERALLDAVKARGTAKRGLVTDEELADLARTLHE
jgi:isopropylmalate/homocitrate/citramalate synthase